MQVPLVLVQRCWPMCPERQSSRPGSRHEPHDVVVHETPPTLALHGCDSVVVVEPVQPAEPPEPEQVGVVHVRCWTPVRSHVFGIVCVHAPHAVHVVAPQVDPTTVPDVQAWLSLLDATTHAPPVQVGVVVVRVCVPISAHVAPTMQADQSEVMGMPQGIPSVARMHACDSAMSMAVQAPPRQCEVVAMRVCVPAWVQGSVPKSHADQSPKVPAAHMFPSVDGRVHACISIVTWPSQVPWLHANPVTLRVCVPPVVAQRSLPKSQAPQAPGTATGQSAVDRQPVQASMAASQCDIPGQGSTPSCTEQVPPPQLSAPLQRTPSSQAAALFVCVQLPAASQPSAVHGSPSSQDVGQVLPPSGPPSGRGPVSVPGPASRPGPVSRPPPPTSAVPPSIPGPPPASTARGSEQPGAATRQAARAARTEDRKAMPPVCDGSPGAVERSITPSG